MSVIGINVERVHLGRYQGRYDAARGNSKDPTSGGAITDMLWPESVCRGGTTIYPHPVWMVQEALVPAHAVGTGRGA